MKKAPIVTFLKNQVPNLLAIYAFGSRIRGDAHAESDLDLAVLVGGYADPLKLWEFAGSLEDLVHCPVDLLDLRAASTVMQYQIITLGERWWAYDIQAALYEIMILREKTELDEARGQQLKEIKQQGTVYGR
ncbi:MAG: nucleotidyltransferase domain-containing protein [Gammaproteobacteria bacterium]|nr:nucleotidyltransferase domain-containing protein [Gammaproteobacteria bacterium]